MNDGGPAFPVKHTSGPWEVVDKSYSGVGILEGLPSVKVVDDELTVAQLCDTGNEEANAHLIAAAPELLEALQWMVEHDETNTSDLENAYFTKGLEKAKAAIAKAMGEG